MPIISAWAKVENSAIAVPSGITAVAKPIGHEHRTDRPAGIVAKTLAGAADVGWVELRHERTHGRELHQDRSIERDPEEQKTGVADRHV